MSDTKNTQKKKAPPRRTSSGLRMKSTCEPCARAKVKCSGPEKTPCLRCAQRDLKCEFTMEKKRGRRFGDNSKAKKTCTATQCWGEVVLSDSNVAQKPDWLQHPSALPLEPHLKRVFQMFFVIYKHHAGPARCCREWFSFHLNKMCLVLMKKGAATIASRLMNWMGSHNIKVTPRDEDYYSKVPEQVMDEVTGQKLPPVLTAKGPQFRGVEATAFESTTIATKAKDMTRFSKNMTVPEQKLVSEMSQGVLLKIKASHEEVEIETNQKFEQLFGYTGEQLTAETKKLLGGFLPWGGDIFAFLFVKDADLLAVMRILAIQFSQLGRPPSFPAHRKVSSMHNLEVYRSDGQTIDCQMKCLHHEQLSARRVKLEIYVGFQPNGPVQSNPHTFNPFLPLNADPAPEIPDPSDPLSPPASARQLEAFTIPSQLNYPSSDKGLLPGQLNMDALVVPEVEPSRNVNVGETNIQLNDSGTYVPNGVDFMDGKPFVRGNQSLSSLDEDWLDGLLAWTDGTALG